MRQTMTISQLESTTSEINSSNEREDVRKHRPWMMWSNCFLISVVYITYKVLSPPGFVCFCQQRKRTLAYGVTFGHLLEPEPPSKFLTGDRNLTALVEFASLLFIFMCV